MDLCHMAARRVAPHAAACAPWALKRLGRPGKDVR